MFAKVFVDISSSNTDHQYEYIVPQHLIPLAQVGVRVKVPFGDSNRLILGYVWELNEESQFQGEIKEIVDILDLNPVISPELFQLADYVKKDTLSPMVRILNLMIPRFMRLKTHKYLLAKNLLDIDANIASLFGGSTRIKWTSILPNQSAIMREIKAGNLEVVYDANAMGGARTVKTFEINENNYHDNIEYFKNPAEIDLLNFLHREREALSIDEIVERFGVTRYAINRLVKEGYLIEKTKQVSRIKNRTIEGIPLYNLSPEDRLNHEEKVNRIFSEPQRVLWIPHNRQEEDTMLALMVEKTQRAGKNLIVVCPDILSSYQISSFLTKVTGLEVACLNSDRSDAEMYDYYQMIVEDNYSVIVTTSLSALFPFQNVGLVVMMNSDSLLYRNEQSPRFLLTKVMRERANIWQVPIVYHSIVPTVEMYAEALVKQFLLLEKRNGYDDLPITIADMKEELLSGHKSPLSRALIQSLKAHITTNKCALLILNNRGYSQFIMCRECGKTIDCDRCAFPMRYHKDPNTLICPLCNKHYVFTQSCPNCGSKYIRHVGLGMEKLQEAILDVLPNARISLLEGSAYEDYETIMDKIHNQDVDIIITTDLFSRSLNHRNITLVAIVLIDLIAKAQRFDAHYQAYTMMEHAKLQLTSPGSELIVQTYDKAMPFLVQAVIGDYQTFFNEELKKREALKVEPIYKINRILVKGPFQQIFQMAHTIKRTIQQSIRGPIIVIGPSYNKREQAVQLIIKHQSKAMQALYERIYRTWQDERFTIIFDKYPKYIV